MSYFVRLSRAQFLPIILTPVLVGTTAAFHSLGTINILFLVLTLVGGAFLLLAANIIDDVYDYVNGVDTVTQRMFPPEFPGWKVIPKGLVSVGVAQVWAYLFYSLGMAIGVYLWTMTGLPTIILAVWGVLLSYFYVAPPLKLAYRGLALGELSIFASFGPITALGAYYVQTLSLDIVPILASIPLGLLTVCVLMNHDLIFFAPYQEAGKRSLAIVLGRKRTVEVCRAVSLFCYVYLTVLVLIGVFPITALAAVPAFIILVRLLRTYSRKELQVPEYARATLTSFVHSVGFGSLLALGLILG